LPRRRSPRKPIADSSRKSIDEAVGTVITVCGTVTAFRCTMSDKVTRLDFDTQPPVDMAIAQADRRLFDPPPEVQYLHRRVCASGLVTKEPSHDAYHVAVIKPADVRFEEQVESVTTATTDRTYSLCDPGVVMPRVLKEVKPQYTSDAMHAKIQGGVLIGAVVGVDGVPRDVTVIRSLDRSNGLDDEALKAVRQWRFVPGTNDGLPVPMRITIEMTFTLGK
jgi:TonB family protein